MFLVKDFFFINQIKRNFFGIFNMYMSLKCTYLSG